MPVPYSITPPSISAPNWGGPLNTALASLAAKHSQADLARGYVLDSFDGVSDDDKFTSALNWAAAQTYKPVILFGNRSYSLSLPRTIYNGFAISGIPASGTEFRYNGRVRITQSDPASGWLALPPGQTKGIYIGDLSFEGNSTTNFFRPTDNTGPVLWASHFKNLGFNLFRTVCHGVHDGVHFSGYWDVNNGYDTAFKLWGADNLYWTDGMLIDSPNVGTGNKYHVWFPYMSKTSVGPVFFTGRKNVTPLRIDGGRGIAFWGMRVDAYAQADQPVWGAGVTITGGDFISLADTWFYGCMANPSGSTHTNPAHDRGIITITGGANIHIRAPMFSTGEGDQPNKTPSGTPHVYVGGGSRVRVRDILSSAGDAPKVVRAPSTSSSAVVTDPDVTVTVG